MNFLYPEFLWAFAVLLIPILIHLFNFKRYKTLYFSSLNFVKHVDQQTKSTQRLRHILILLSRLLAFIFLVLAFAQPYFKSSESAANERRSLMNIFLDNSFSMQARGIEGELLSEARETARKVVNDAPQGTQFIIGTNEMSGIERRRLSKIEALEKLDKIDYSPLSRDLNEIINWQHTVGTNEYDGEESLNQSIILSDFQKSALSNSDSLNLSGFHFHPVQLLPEQTTNIFIDSIWFSTPIRRVNNQNELNIRIVNKSDDDLENVEVNVSVDRFNKNFYVDLPANERTQTSITYSDKSPGYKTGKVQVFDDHVLFDDTYYLSYEVKTNANVLVLNGEDAINNIGVVLGLESYYLVQENDLTSITLDNFKNKDLVIVNGANRLSSGVRNYLLDFRKNGGSLSMFPGKSPDLNEWNSFLVQAELPGMGKTISSGTKISSLNYEDVFIQGIIASKSERLNLPSVKKAFQPIVSSSSNYRTLISMQNGLPLLSYSVGAGNVYMFYSSIHQDWGAFSSDALFSTMILRMSELSQRAQPISLTIGEQSTFPIYKNVSNDQAIHLSNGTVDFIPQSSVKSGIIYLSLNQFDKFEQLLAGNYQISNGQPIGSLAINYNRKESELIYQNETEIVDFLKSKGADNVSFKAMDGINVPLSALEISKPLSYWKICIVFTLIFVLAEMLLVRFWKK